MISEIDYKNLVRFVKDMPLSPAKVNVIASVLHTGQTDRGGHDYMEHLQFVAEVSCRILRSRMPKPCAPPPLQQRVKDVRRIADKMDAFINRPEALSRHIFHGINETSSVHQYAVGMLHDSIEDATIRGEGSGEVFRLCREDLLAMGLPTVVVEAVALLTKKDKPETDAAKVDRFDPLSLWHNYQKQISHLMSWDASTPASESYVMALCAKIADNQHNKDLERLRHKDRAKPQNVARSAMYSISESFLTNQLFRVTQASPR
ncbi:hypothetical protein AA14337_2979 [Acetobacter malorum DSM 14337]|uniref:Uncharacterized protein n=1 Tax=Acetobacter malorum DSM 14337 TaxID=1307910 RepID=A0ABQ0PYX9_9PROT|nr:hypothetical protein [Acetobacter malorum]GBQ85045.1 hypothetical protein AA14337_2979 [Acetobacter malorum DSM 14337]